MDHWLAIPHGDWRPFIPIFLAASSVLPYSCALVQGCCVSNTMATWEKRWNQDGGQLRCFAGDQMCIKLHLPFFKFAININNDRIRLATLKFPPPKSSFLIKGSTHLPRSSEVEVHRWRLFSTILIQIYLLILPFYKEKRFQTPLLPLKLCTQQNYHQSLSNREGTLSELMLIKDSSKVH